MRKFMNKLITFLLAVLLFVNSLNFEFLVSPAKETYAYAKTTASAAQPDEISLALEAGLTTPEIVSRAESDLTEKDFCYMLDRLLEKKSGTAIDDILRSVNPLMASFDGSGTYGKSGQLDLSKTTHHTVYGTTVKETLLQGHEDDGSNDLHLLGLTNLIFDYKAFRSRAGENTMKRYDAANRLWNTARMLGFDRDNGDQDYVTYGGYKWEDNVSLGVYFVCGTADKKGNRIMTAGYHDDTKVYFQSDNAMTTEDAIKAVYRLYNTEVPKITSLENVPALTLSSELKSYINASTLPDASFDNLPYWTGVNLTGKDLNGDYYEANGATIHTYNENQVRYLSELGFNCIRVMVGYRMISSYYDEEMIIMPQLENIDNLIKWGAKYNVHIMLDMHTLPGWGCSTNGVGNRDLATDKNEQELSLRYWQMFARRYQNIPNKILSFNLFNEPYPVDDDKNNEFIGSEDFWEGFILKLTNGIRAIDSNRLIITDSFIHRIPFQGLTDDKLAQSIHIYDPSDLTINGYGGGSVSTYTGTWPVPIVTDTIYDSTTKNYVPFTLKGNFPAGTKITLDVNNFTTDASKVTLTAAMNEALSDTSKSDEVSRNYTGKLTITTKSDATSLILYASPVGGNYAHVKINDLFVTKPNGTSTNLYPIKLGMGWQPGDTRGHTLSIYEDGSYSSDSYIGNDSSKGIVDSWYPPLLADFLKLRSGSNKTDFICGEFGVISSTDSKIALGVYDTLLSYLQKNRVSWLLFSMGTNFGFLYSGYKDTVLQEGYPLNKTRLHLLQKYMSEKPITEEVKSISISDTSLTLKVGATYQLKAKVSNAATATNPRIGWFTTNRSVVAVNSDGKLEVTGSGTATITAEAVDGSGVLASCKVTVPEQAKQSIKLYQYNSQKDLEEDTNAKRLGIYLSFDEIKKVMDQEKNKNSYYKILLTENNNTFKNITFSSYAKQIRICGTSLGWNNKENFDEYTKLTVGGTITANSEIILEKVNLCSQKDKGTIHFIGNGYKTTFYDCRITVGTFDASGKKGNASIQIKNNVFVKGKLTNVKHLTIGYGTNVKDKHGNFDSSSYQYEVALLRIKGSLSNIGTLSSYEGRLTLTSDSSATFNKIDGVMLFLYLGKSKTIAKVTLKDNLTMYNALMLVAINDTDCKDTYGAAAIPLKEGEKIVTTFNTFSQNSIDKICVAKNTSTWDSSSVTLSGKNLLVGDIR